MIAGVIAAVIYFIIALATGGGFGSVLLGAVILGIVVVVISFVISWAIVAARTRGGS